MLCLNNPFWQIVGLGLFNSIISFVLCFILDATSTQLANVTSLVSSVAMMVSRLHEDHQRDRGNGGGGGS